MSKPLVYLASPFSSFKKTKKAQEAEKEGRFQTISQVAGELFALGYAILCPIAQSHPMTLYSEFKGSLWEAWKELDTLMLSRCDQMFIADMEGWEKSVGVRGEIIVAITLDIPIYLVELDENSNPTAVKGLRYEYLKEEIVGKLTKVDNQDIKNLISKQRNKA